MKLYTVYSIISLTILLVVQSAGAAKGRQKPPVQEPPDENEPPRKKQKGKGGEPSRRISVGVRGVSTVPQYVGLDPQPRPPPHINETGYYNLPSTFWFSPNNRDAKTLADATHAAIIQVFNSYPQNILARTRMNEQIDRHREA